MLRACHRVLRRAGRIAFTVIALAPEIPTERRTAALETSPGFIEADAPYPYMLADIGFDEITSRDVTDEYRATSARWLHEAAELEPGMREALGDRMFEEKQAIRQASLASTEAGDVVRLLYTARRP